MREKPDTQHTPDRNGTRICESSGDHANVMVRPPRLYLAGLILGGLIDYIRPLTIGSWTMPGDAMDIALRAPGLAAIAVGVAVVIQGHRLFRRAGTTVPTGLPTDALVNDGLYRYSRNPIYVGLTAIYAGVALLADNLWMVGLLIPILIVMQRGVIAREEAYLTGKFGDAYLAYKSRVRRWF